MTPDPDQLSFEDLLDVHDYVHEGDDDE
ncbi:hypothetical protein PBI_TRIKE_53 [Mycobacterium phage Trike]|nr:hypothetical protein VC70_gp18 [Mycobacterium phage Trike]AIK69092.1 hypothetical protein PBI_TRIKE_53 [Mycobacterium phage Trike]